MKIIIIRAGIAGLSSYIFLTKHLVRERPTDYSITIYEAYDVKHGQVRHDAHADAHAPGREVLPHSKDEDGDLFTAKVIGNAIGLGKNGLTVLSRMDVDEDGALLTQIQRRGNCVSKWRIMTARGWKIVDASVRSGPDPDAGGPTVADTVMIARQAAWEVLRDRVLSIDGDAVIKKKVAAIETNSESKVVLHFSDGSTDEADLLIHWCRRSAQYCSTALVQRQRRPQTAVLGRLGDEEDTGEGRLNHATQRGAYWSRRLRAERSAQEDRGATTVDIGGSLAAWWSTFSSASPLPYQKATASDVADRDNDNAASSADIKTVFDKTTALKECLQRHRSWSDPTIQAILSYLEANEAIEHMYPTYTTPELRTWKSGSDGTSNSISNTGIVLIGDAAHALQPSSGQGACQALEDAEALALFLRHYLHTDTDTTTASGPRATATGAVDRALSAFVALRIPRIARIYKQSQKMGGRKTDMGFVMEYVMYFAIRVGVKTGTGRNITGNCSRMICLGRLSGL
ncbi:hypothetical protein LTR70_005205 [Exophiala xenobiotica]|uniref:FAD-binding domain-containing protein n=1 Tax=Lithohypha guttulata TaxID=1690604 RepID=A0ABR0KB16_9EURO|nr:hypothetical protein LTR24_004726 [Lithohypha guttulata]KAK5318909.1 hypothetical protein LTR70_005205 [Exophiala xenobiotica]